MRALSARSADIGRDGRAAKARRAVPPRRASTRWQQPMWRVLAAGRSGLINGCDRISLRDLDCKHLRTSSEHSVSEHPLYAAIAANKCLLLQPVGVVADRRVRP